jgi:hypothetical protein
MLSSPYQLGIIFQTWGINDHVPLDNWMLEATDPTHQDDLATTLNNIIVQLTSISNRLDLQGSALARHVQLLEGAEGSTASGTIAPSQAAGPNGGPAMGGGQGEGTA